MRVLSRPATAPAGQAPHLRGKEPIGDTHPQPRGRVWTQKLDGGRLHPMKTTRRQFVKANLAGTLVATVPASFGAAAAPALNARYAKLDEILRQPVLKRAWFASPVIIEKLELLRHKNSFLCRVRSRDGAEGISV